MGVEGLTNPQRWLATTFSTILSKISFHNARIHIKKKKKNVVGFAA